MRAERVDARERRVRLSEISLVSCVEIAPECGGVENGKYGREDVRV